VLRLPCFVVFVPLSLLDVHMFTNAAGFLELVTIVFVRVEFSRTPTWHLDGGPNSAWRAGESISSHVHDICGTSGSVHVCLFSACLYVGSFTCDHESSPRRGQSRMFSPSRWSGGIEVEVLRSEAACFVLLDRF